MENMSLANRPPVHESLLDLNVSLVIDDELRREIRYQLEEYWKFERRDLTFRRNTKLSWLDSGYMITLDQATPDPNHAQLRRLYNKATALYIAPLGQKYVSLPYIVFGCIYKDWFLHYNNEPDFEFGRFFATPVHVTSNGPQAAAEIVQAHKILCDQASKFLEEQDRAQSLSPGSQLTSKTHKLLPLVRAVILIYDEEDESIEEDENGCVSLDEYSQVQSVLMIRTGDEAHLSAPITFEHIKEQAFELKRSDCQGMDVVRVSLATAFQFITTLQQKEDTAMPSIMINMIDRSLCPADYPVDYQDLSLSADVWAEKMLQHADKLGFETVFPVKDALVRALAARRGDDSQKLRSIHFTQYWK